MYRRMSDFTKAWSEEAKITLRVLDAIPDEAMDQPVAEGHRSLRRLAWHLVESLIEMPGRWGLTIAGREFMTPEGGISDPPPSMSAVRDAYAAASDSLLAQVAGWTDASLDIEDDMYGEKWSRAFSLSVLVVHQVHHRGQMTVLMRQAGLKVPDIYGPAKEGWAAYGAPPPRV